MKRDGYTGHWCTIPECGASWQFLDDLAPAAIVAVSGNRWGMVGESIYCPKHYAEVMQLPKAGT